MVSTFDVLYSKLEREQLGTGIQVALQHNTYTAATVSDVGTLQSASWANTDLEFLLTGDLEESTTEAYGYNFTYEKDNLTINADFSYSTAKYDWEGDQSTVMAFTDGTKTVHCTIVPYHLTLLRVTYRRCPTQVKI